MDISYEGGMHFTAETTKGLKIPIDAHVHLGGSGISPNPIDYLISSLGGCIGIKIILALSDKAIIPDLLTIGIHATRKQTLPAIFDRVHLTITLKGVMNEGMMNTILTRTMTELCPIAAMFMSVSEVTFEQRIVRD